MKRLTTDNPKDNIENALNLFYAKDGWTWVRGGGPAPDYADMSLCDFVRMLVKANIPDAELPEDDDDLSDLMHEWLIDEPDGAEGIISLLYTAGWAFAELRHRLSLWENTGLNLEHLQANSDIDFARAVEVLCADADGRLVVLPCKVGDTVWLLQKKCKYAGEQNKPWSSCNQYWDNVCYKKMWGCAGRDENGNKFECEKKEMMWYAKEMQYSLVLYRDDIVLGKNLFLTREEAERALEGQKDG